jgi:hypothetical protein
MSGLTNEDFDKLKRVNHRFYLFSDNIFNDRYFKVSKISLLGQSHEKVDEIRIGLGPN